ncbi:unnamed protein product, partial [Allacma fusca]
LHSIDNNSAMCQLFGILPSKIISKILLAVLFLSMAGQYLKWNGPQIINTQILQSFNESYESNLDSFRLDLVENQIHKKNGKIHKF